MYFQFIWTEQKVKFECILCPNDHNIYISWYSSIHTISYGNVYISYDIFAHIQFPMKHLHTIWYSSAHTISYENLYISYDILSQNCIWKYLHIIWYSRIHTIFIHFLGFIFIDGWNYQKNNTFQELYISLYKTFLNY